jgi:hypothetical protein
MCVSRVTRHTAVRYLSPCHTRVNMGALIFFTAAMMCVSTVIHTSNISNCQKKLFQFSCGRSFGFLLINICNHGDYDTPCTYKTSNSSSYTVLAETFRYKSALLSSKTDFTWISKLRRKLQVPVGKVMITSPVGNLIARLDSEGGSSAQ